MPDNLIASKPFFVRDYRSGPVATVSDDENMHCPYTNMLHDPDTDAEMGQHGGATLRDLFRGADRDGTVYRMVLVPTGQKAALVRVPWVLVKPNTYAQNPLGEPKGNVP